MHDFLWGGCCCFRLVLIPYARWKILRFQHVILQPVPVVETFFFRNTYNFLCKLELQYSLSVTNRSGSTTWIIPKWINIKGQVEATIQYYLGNKSYVRLKNLGYLALVFGCKNSTLKRFSRKEIWKWMLMERMRIFLWWLCWNLMVMLKSWLKEIFSVSFFMNIYRY